MLKNFRLTMVMLIVCISHLNCFACESHNLEDSEVNDESNVTDQESDS